MAIEEIYVIQMIDQKEAIFLYFPKLSKTHLSDFLKIYAKQFVTEIITLSLPSKFSESSTQGSTMRSEFQQKTDEFDEIDQSL